MKHVKVTVDNRKKVMKNLKRLLRLKVAVGVPDTTAKRQDQGGKQSVSNALLASVFEQGSPATGMPPRPHIHPGATQAAEAMKPQLGKAIECALRGKPDDAKASLDSAGQLWENQTKKIIVDKIAPPLALSTIKARARRLKASGKGLHNSTKGPRRVLAAIKAGKDSAAAQADEITPLVIDGSYKNSITHVVLDGDSQT